MFERKSLNAVLGTVALATFLASTATSNAGLIDLLKGEKAPSQVAYQRVALVGSAQVKEVNGTAEILHGIEEWRPLQPSANLRPGDLVRTQEGMVVLKMRDSGSFIRLRPNTILRLSPLREGWDKSVLTGAEHRTGFIVRALRGNATVQDPKSGGWKRVTTDMALPEGAVVRTEADAAINLFYTSAKAVVHIAPGQEVRLNPELARKPAASPALAANLSQR